MEDKIFQSDAKSIVDMLFENKLFREDLTRDRMNALEDYILFLLQSRFDSYKKIDSLLLGIKRDKERNETKESTNFETDTVARKATP